MKKNPKNDRKTNYIKIKDSIHIYTSCPFIS